MKAPPQRALSLLQPWATLVVRGIKRVETRAWHAKLEPDEALAIHASKGDVDPAVVAEVLDAAGVPLAEYSSFPRGAVLGCVSVPFMVPSAGVTPRLLDHVGRERLEREKRLGDWTPGRWLWALKDPVELRAPIYWSGEMGCWRVSPALAKMIAEHRP